MKSPGKVIIIIILSCVLYLVLGMVNSDSAFACAWYAGSDGNTTGGSDGGPPPNCKNGCCGGAGGGGGGGGNGPGGPPPGGDDRPPSILGDVGDPVNVATGNCIETYTDLIVSSPGIPVAIQRSFNNVDFRVSSIGWGWRFSLDMRVIFVSDNFDAISHAVIINPDGKRDTYTKGIGDTFDPPAGVYNSLILNPDGTATLNTKNSLTYTFNQGGRLTEIKDLNGNTLTINYTDNSPTAEITTVVDSVGRTYNFTYENGKIKTITDPASRVVTYTYNGDLLTEVTNPLNETTIYGYNPSTYDLLTITSPEGDTYVTNTYDSRWRVVTQNHAGRLYDFEYYDGYTEVTEQGQYTSTYYYNTTYYFITKYIDPFGKETTYQWDIFTKQLNSITDPLGNVTSYTYDDNGNILTVTQTISATESKTTTYTYNSFNKPLTITDPEGNVTTYTYTTDGKENLYSIEDPLGNTTYFEEYNANGQVTKIKDANGKYTNITYDQYGYIDSVTDPLTRTIYFTNDIVGNRTQVKDALNRTTDYFYENSTRLDYIVDDKGQITDYEYDLNGNIKKVTDARGHNTHFEYNEINQLTAIKDHFLNIKASYSYDSRHNLQQVTNARGETINYTYDALNRVKTKTLNGAYGADVVNYTYDDVGRLETINNNAADLTHGYDAAHRLTSVTTGGAMPGTTISYDYYKNDKRQTMTDAIGVTQYIPPSLSDPLEYIHTPNMGTFTFSFDSLKRKTGMTMGNGITATYTYDDASQLESSAFKDGVNPVTSNQYTLYDAVGNRKTEIEEIPFLGLSGTHNYDYDSLYRLTSATHPAGNPTESFNYDPVGNRTDSHLSSSYITNDLNRVTEDDSYLYDYDADGNLISKQDKTTNYITYYYYDAENKLVGVDKYDSTPILTSTISYAYDGLGRRVKKDVDTVVTYYIYDNEDIRFETDAVGAITAEYTHGSGIDEPLAMRRNGANYYYHVNGLGTVTALTDSSKTVIQSYEYDSFGQIISQTGSITNPYTYTGREYDEETGMYYYRARYYDASIGRFMSEDPIGIRGGINLYAYVLNNPVNWVDPLGLVSCNGYWKPAYENIMGLNCWTCWLCIPCDGAAIWSGRRGGLPCTKGTTYVDKYGRRRCMPNSKPGPEKDCRKCT